MKWLTVIGLGLDVVGIIIIFFSSKRIESMPALVDAPKYLGFQKRVRWGLGFVVIGTFCQLVGAVLSK